MNGIRSLRTVPPPTPTTTTTITQRADIRTFHSFLEKA
jgi:hypothetical protein